jgi:hypothetical protein
VLWDGHAMGATAPIQADGTFAAHVVVPDTAGTGDHFVYAQCVDGGGWARTTFTVPPPPAVTTTPGTGPAGTRITVRGSGYDGCPDYGDRTVNVALGRPEYRCQRADPGRRHLLRRDRRARVRRSRRPPRLRAVPGRWSVGANPVHRDIAGLMPMRWWTAGVAERGRGAGMIDHSDVDVGGIPGLAGQRDLQERICHGTLVTMTPGCNSSRV